MRNPWSVSRAHGQERVGDLARLSEIASQDRDDLSDPSGKWPDYRGRQVLVVLAQGGAQQYLGGSTGVKDLDVWSFFARVPGHALRWGSGTRTRTSVGRSLDASAIT